VTRPGYVLAIVVPLGVLLGLLAADRRRERGEVGRTEAASRPIRDGERDGPRDPIDLGAIRSRDFFYEDAQVVDVGGERVRFARGLFCAKTAEGLGLEELTATDLVWLANDPPRNRAAVERLVSVDAGLGGEAAGAAVRAAFGRISGVRADRAVVRGDASTGEIRSLTLDGGVAAVFSDPETPNDRIDVETPDRLVVEFEGGRPVRARADGAVRVRRPLRRDAEVDGEGMTATFARGDGRVGVVSEIVVDRKIDARLNDPAAVGFDGPSIRIAAAGPLRLVPGGRGGGGAAAEVETTLEIGGAIEGNRGDLRFKATRGRLVVGGSQGRRRLFEGEDGVFAEGDGFTLNADRAVVDARKDGNAVFHAAKTPGPPITVVLSGAHLPGGGETTTLTCAGAATVGPSADPFAPARDVTRLHASVKVVATWASGSLEAGDATLWTGRVGDRRRPLKMVLARGVRGSTDEGDVRADEFEFRRDFGDDGEARTETFRLRRDYAIVYRGESFLAKATPKNNAAASRPESAPATRAGTPTPFDVADLRGALGLLRSADVLEIEGSDVFDAVRGVEPGAPSLASSKGRATYRLLDRSTGRVAASLAAARASIVLAPIAVDGADGAKVRRRVESFSAEGGVVAEVPGVATGTGGVARLRLEEGEVVLTGSPERKARVAALSRDGASTVAAFEAGAFAWNAEALRLTAEAAVVGDFRMPLLPWIEPSATAPPLDAPAAKTPIETRATAARVVAYFVPAAESGDPTLRELAAIGGATLEQKPLRSVSCSTFVVDVGSKTGTLSGSPAFYRARRVEGGAMYEDVVSAPRASFVGDAWTLDGPVDGMVHVAPAANALRVGVAPGGGSAADDQKPTPIRVKAVGGALSRPDLMKLFGGVSADQGRPDRDGFAAKADEATFLFTPGIDGSNDLGIASLRGAASFRSRGLTAEGDVMSFDRPARTLTLYNERPSPVRFRVEGGFDAPSVFEASGLVAVFRDRNVSVTLKDVSTILEEEKASRAGEIK
jgi:hypothetical protein